MRDTKNRRSRQPCLPYFFGAAKKGAGANVAGGMARGEAAGSGAAAMAAGMGCITPKLKRLRGTAGPGEGWAKEAMTGATGTGGGGC